MITVSEAKQYYRKSDESILWEIHRVVTDRASGGFDYAILDWGVWEEEFNVPRDNVVKKLQEMGYHVSQGTDSWIISWSE